MKKLTVVLAAIGITAMANAASVSWSVTTAKTNVGYDVYLTRINTFAALSDVTGNLLGTSGNTGTTALATSTARNATATGSALGLTGETSYDFYYVFIKGDDYWVSDKQTVATNAETAGPAAVQLTATASNALLSGAKSGSFAVPEPTSGILLLLGIAGLALKRKRA